MQTPILSNIIRINFVCYDVFNIEKVYRSPHEHIHWDPLSSSRINKKQNIIQQHNYCYLQQE